MISYAYDYQRIFEYGSEQEIIVSSCGLNPSYILEPIPVYTNVSDIGYRVSSDGEYLAPVVSAWTNDGIVFDVGDFQYVNGWQTLRFNRAPNIIGFIQLCGVTSDARYIGCGHPCDVFITPYPLSLKPGVPIGQLPIGQVPVGQLPQLPTGGLPIPQTLQCKVPYCAYFKNTGLPYCVGCTSCECG